jgi:hypothetical protein
MKKHEIFETNPNLKKVHMTSDGQSFYNDSDARMHAKSLEDKKVELVVNPDFLDVVAEVVSAEDNGDAAKVIDLKKLNKEALINFGKENELTIDESLTKAKIVESFEAQLLEKSKNAEASEEDVNTAKTEE